MKKLTQISLTTQILLATVGGIIFGSVASSWAIQLRFIGDIFLRLIQMSVVLLVMSAIAAAVGDGDGKDTGRMGYHTFKWIILFTAVAAFLGMGLSILIQPGRGVELLDAAQTTQATVESLSPQDTLVNFVPSNVMNAMAEGNMIQCIVFALLFGVAMGSYTRQTGNRQVIDWVKGINATVTNIIKLVMKIAPIGIFCLLAHVAA